MEQTYKKERYNFGKGCSLSYTHGTSAEKSTLSFSHYTNSCMFYYFIKGSGNIKVEGKSYDICKGDLVLVNPSELYRCEIFDNVFHERFVLRVNHSILDNFSDDAIELISPFYKRVKGIGNLIPAKINEETGIKMLFEEIFTLAKAKSPCKNVLAVCKTVELLSRLSGLILPDRETKNLKKENPIINDVLLFLNNNFREDISVISVAKTFNLSESYLSHLFKEYVGISIWNYIVYKRLNYFNDLICNNYSINEAYLMSGFQNYSNFFRLYKKYMNMTPSEFKQSIT